MSMPSYKNCHIWESGTVFGLIHNICTINKYSTYDEINK